MSAAPSHDSPLLLELLDEQQDLSAVERFAQLHEDVETPLLAPTYEALLPTTRTPGSDEQYAFRVDLDACTGCKACVTACHSLNGLDTGETWRRVGVVHEAETLGAQQTVTTACHHCEDPGCMNGCPVRAYEKDPITGIVRHLDDQCIGCKYCTLTCPYEVPQYDAGRGIVRKCDMCTDRLAEGEAPACVQGCPNGAISIDVVPMGGELAPLLPGEAGGMIPSSALTRPTTRYVSRKPTPLTPADWAEPEPRSAHWPLAILTVMTQLSLGLLTFACAAPLFGIDAVTQRIWLGASLLAAIAGQAAAMFHLGRPHLAFRAVLGLRTSWMSREIVALGSYLGLLGACFALSMLPVLQPLGWLPPLPAAVMDELPGVLAAAAALTLVAGWAGLYTQAMIYVATGRPYWKLARTGPRFAGTALLLGAGAAVTLSGGALALPGLALVVGAGVALWKAQSDDRLAQDPDPVLRRSGWLLEGPLAERDRARKRALATGAGLLSLGFAASAIGVNALAALPAAAGLAAWIAAELFERNLFFRAESMPAMPGL